MINPTSGFGRFIRLNKAFAKDDLYLFLCSPHRGLNFGLFNHASSIQSVP